MGQNTSNSPVQAASAGWADYSQQPTPIVSPQEPQPPSVEENESNTEGWNAYRQQMAQYWANWSSSSNNESSSKETKIVTTESNLSQPPLPPTNHPSLSKDTSLS